MPLPFNLYLIVIRAGFGRCFSGGDTFLAVDLAAYDTHIKITLLSHLDYMRDLTLAAQAVCFAHSHNVRSCRRLELIIFAADARVDLGVTLFAAGYAALQSALDVSR